MAMALRLPVDCIKTPRSVCLDQCAAGKQKSEFPVRVLSQWELRSGQWGGGHVAEGPD